MQSLPLAPTPHQSPFSRSSCCCRAILATPAACRIDFDSIAPEVIAQNFDAEFKKQASKYPMDLPSMKKLYDAVDVIGVSGEPLLILDVMSWFNQDLFWVPVFM